MTIFNINLIAARRRAKQRAAAMMRLGVYSLIALALGVILLYYVLDTRVQQLSAQVAKVAEELSSPSLGDSVKQIQYLETQQALLQPRVQILEKVHSSESEWIRIISDVGTCAPQGNELWLVQMNSSRTEKNQSINLKGQAFRLESIGNYLLSLSEPQWSADPTLSKTQAHLDEHGETVIDFEITVPLQTVIGSDLK